MQFDGHLDGLAFGSMHVGQTPMPDDWDETGRNRSERAEITREAIERDENERNKAERPEPDYASASLETLEDEIGTLAAHLNAASYRLLALIAELDRREPWARLNCLSCAHYLNWRCGIALGAAREKVRAARALRELPLIREAFRSGWLSYSKVRALTRVATPANEAELLGIARYGTATHVERVVRHYRQALAAMSPERLLQSRSFESYWDEDGMLVIRGRLTAEQGAVLLKALSQESEAAADNRALASAEGSVGEEDPAAAMRADALSRICEGYLAHEGGTSHTADRYQVRIDVPARTLAARSSEGLGPQDLAVVEGDGPPLSLQTVQRLCCDASLVAVSSDAADGGEAVKIGSNIGSNIGTNLRTKTRTIPVSLRRALRRRDGGCRFPGCTNTRHVDAHHVVHWAHGGATTLANLVLLCRRHHTFVHERGYRIEAGIETGVAAGMETGVAAGLETKIETATETESSGRSRRRCLPRDRLMRFRFFNTHGWEIEPNAKTRSRGNVAQLLADNARLGIEVSASTAQSQWDGGVAPDYDHILFTLLQRAAGAGAHSLVRNE